MIADILKIVASFADRNGSNRIASKTDRRPSRRFAPVVGLERLEGRDVPSTMMVPDFGMGMGGGTITVTNQDTTPPPPADGGPPIITPVITVVPPADPGPTIILLPPPTVPPAVGGPILA